MNYKSSFPFILFTVILVNAGGFILRYFEYSTYFIFLGFRFHLGLLLPFLLFLRKENLFLIKETFSRPGYRGKFIPLLWILIPLITLCIVPFAVSFIKEGDPEYFYEFGLTSILDFPVYLLWNFPQLVLFYLFLVLALYERRFKFFGALFLIFFLFFFEFVSAGKNTSPALDYYSLGILFLAAVISSVFFSFYENIYWFSTSIFSILWIYFLAFGSNSQLIINMLFAANYKSWDGFLLVDKDTGPYMIFSYLFLIIIIICAALPFRSSRVSKDELDKTGEIAQLGNTS